MKISQFAGNRIIKTGVAVFLTAWICELFNWPPVFAVITAIVTIEPTVNDSIKKGIIRFPASAIGSAFAVLFISLFGDSPVTYAFAAVLTIATCFKLKLHEGLLVATLTSVAMVEVIHSNYLISFFIRLGTTTTGLLISTAVNMFVFPPHYSREVVENIKNTSRDTGILIEKTFTDILEEKDSISQSKTEMMERLDKKWERTQKLIHFQKNESKYHPLVGHEKQVFLGTEQQLTKLRLIHYHLDNVLNTEIVDISWSQNERAIILKAVKDLAYSLQNPEAFNDKQHTIQINLLMTQFWEDNGEITTGNKRHPTHFTPELIILYELVSISNLVTNLYRSLSD
ncbi:aromatic acid exporter family protein [Virgibacillus flavescens]|uniref:aromatic acid exporter family protein n=1 Tax=Virgibacillus flavescens TaxID=1611422 RepID=UPI003D338BAF